MLFFDVTEPGYYEQGKFGIRIEDVIQAVKLETPLRGNFDGEGVLAFYDITMAPIQRKLIDETMLTAEEVSLKISHSTESNWLTLKLFFTVFRLLG